MGYFSATKKTIDAEGLKIHMEFRNLEAGQRDDPAKPTFQNWMKETSAGPPL